MRLIDADKLNRKKKYSFQTVFGCFPKSEWFIKLEDLFQAPTIDPVHAAGGCYCRECFHSALEKYEDSAGWVTPMDEYWCNEHKITMPLNGFCSEGRKDDTKNA